MSCLLFTVAHFSSCFNGCQAGGGGRTKRGRGAFGYNDFYVTACASKFLHFQQSVWILWKVRRGSGALPPPPRIIWVKLFHFRAKIHHLTPKKLSLGGRVNLRVKLCLDSLPLYSIFYDKKMQYLDHQRQTRKVFFFQIEERSETFSLTKEWWNN